MMGISSFSIPSLQLYFFKKYYIKEIQEDRRINGIYTSLPQDKTRIVTKFYKNNFE